MFKVMRFSFPESIQSTLQRDQELVYNYHTDDKKVQSWQADGVSLSFSGKSLKTKAMIGLKIYYGG